MQRLAFCSPVLGLLLLGCNAADTSGDGNGGAATATSGSSTTSAGAGGGATGGGGGGGMQASDLDALTYGDAGFVAAAGSFGAQSYLLHSADGHAWTAQPTGIDSGVPTGAAFGNSVYVVPVTIERGGITGAHEPSLYLTSSDGVSWTSHASALGVNDIGFGNGRFVSIGNGDALDGKRPSLSNLAFTSTDGDGWSSTASPAELALFIGFGAGSFVVVGAIGAPGTAEVSSAPENAAWASSTPLADRASFTSRPSFAAGQFWAPVGKDGGGDDSYHHKGTATSPDGMTWTTRWDAELTRVIEFGGGLVALSPSGVLRSEDAGATWTRLSAPDFGYDPLLATDGHVLVVGRPGSDDGTLGGLFASSEDGITWRDAIVAGP